ncbi:MAG: CCA tRNA nucleotidyltransferase [Rhodoferax sp.]|nr:CCA tRNA nucleotidyltransferase [Pseudorhodobacter sp.]
MKIKGPWLHAAGTQALMAALLSSGHSAFFVGGCVRNAIIGMAVGDIDIATDALPEDVVKIAMAAGFRAIPTGMDHGTVTVIADGILQEVTTLRRDVQTDGRHAVVAFSTDVAEDAARRDFTMNALYAKADGSVIDPLNGLPDLIARRVRFVGQAEARIVEDYLRILRFFRFHAIYGDPTQGIDAEGLAACAKNLAGLDTLSRERVGAEMRKLLSAHDPALSLAAMEQAGILARVLPGATSRMVPVLVHFEDGSPQSWLCRLAVLGGEDVTDTLRLSRAEAATLAQICAETGTVTAPDALGWMYGIAVAGDILHVRAAVFAAALPPQWRGHALRGVTAVFPVVAADLMPGLQGPALGKMLKALQDRWLSSGLCLTKADLLA